MERPKLKRANFIYRPAFKISVVKILARSYKVKRGFQWARLANLHKKLILGKTQNEFQKLIENLFLTVLWTVYHRKLNERIDIYQRCTLVSPIHSVVDWDQRIFGMIYDIISITRKKEYNEMPAKTTTKRCGHIIKFILFI